MSTTFVTPQARTVLIRACQGFEELDACVQVQVDVWGYSDGDVIPRRVFTVTQKIGGQVLAAFDVSDGTDDTSENLVGFAMALPAVRPQSGPGATPEPYLHSHMLAVRPEFRNAGIGRRLKLAQREDALAKGFQLMEWTFDPLEIKNSFLNIHRLGAIVRRYTSNFYGVSSSRLQGGLPTDRLHAEWWMQSERVEAILSDAPTVKPNTEQANQIVTIQETITVPHEIGKWKSSVENQDRALAVQSENRQRFEKAFARGLAVIDFRTDAEGNGIFGLGHWQEPVFSIPRD
ncbi:GNAT family N-acetyltransferase [Alloacidobacterium dinghuense]|uniref:GNAT family N-acetyltransferase n=1 Tax=Alloacidobacterium dinghuense TaxID=2763107 RepID=A0A7G8BCG0_9BACT|nr:GNAT family N-acetyltransferase [Alloacidobacterium dinghuense]QNI30230.1 GNAT family N-acetyltransferase [Alloacidobacterium dinghuense]